MSPEFEKRRASVKLTAARVRLEDVKPGDQVRMSMFGEPDGSYVVEQVTPLEDGSVWVTMEEVR